tara:strand:- start:150997 stop:151785 length:789 start_codon:yes stop_codon:yes gene_type:complete
MITSILDKDFKGDVFEDMENERGIQHLGAIFNKLCLPLPDDDEVQVTREKGFNLFLNHYGCVVRFYEREYTIPDTDIKTANEHFCHHLSLPFIGHVRFGKFNMQIMPGVIPVDNVRFKKSVQATFILGLNSVCDTGAANLGHLHPNKRDHSSVVLLDTVQSFEEIEDSYELYLKYNNERIVERSNFVSDLQENFYKAWTSDKPSAMNKFWEGVHKTHKQGERLHAGWLEENNPILNKENFYKEDFVAKSKDYHERFLALKAC